MRRFFPKSLLGQVMASVMLALLVAQIVSATLLFRAGEDRREVSALSALAFQLAAGTDRVEQLQQRVSGEAREPGERRAARTRQDGENAQKPRARRLPRLLRYRLAGTSPIAPGERGVDPDRTQRLRELLEIEGLSPYSTALTLRRAGDDPALAEFARVRPRFAQRENWRERRIFVAAIQRVEGGEWEVARVFERPRPRGQIPVLIMQTLVMFAFLIVILYLVLRRITRPLEQLTQRVADFARSPDRAVQLEESGPADTRRLIAAHNAMEARIAAMLDEKDVMLGAIGHDLKTPLAALRVRIESVPDDVQRARMADSIEDITRTLDDILALARVGRANGIANAEAVDLSALADSVMEEFEDLGEPVTLAVPEGRLVARVHETWLKRAIRNLVGNAVRYGGAARVSLIASDEGALRIIILRVDDDGPGIPEDLIADMLEPFRRGEASRNRGTGGAGLGLTLARAIAVAHDGELVLTNRHEGGRIVGLRAEIRLPG